MSILDEIRDRLAVPPNFGADAPYVRFSRVEDDRGGGEDITLEYQAAEVPGEPDLIVFGYSEWRATPQRLKTQLICAVTLVASTGEPRVQSPAVRAELTAVIRSALVHADQMQRVG